MGEDNCGVRGSRSPWYDDGPGAPEGENKGTTGCPTLLQPAPGWQSSMPGNRRLWGFTVSELDRHLTYMINIALTTEFTIPAGG